MKRFTPFWKMDYDSIQEPPPHHTVLCMHCGSLYNREGKIEKECRECGVKFKKNKISEFYVGKKKIYYGKDLEKRRKYL